jgi:hypothetical protein
MSHIAYEVEMCALSGMRMVIATDQHARNAYLECTLLHARALEEFLVLAPRSPRPDDMRRTEFAREWNPHPSHAVARLGSRRITVNKNLAHLTWTRVDDPEPPEWPFIEIADDTVAIARAWVPHVTADEGKDLQDPDIKAQLLWNAVRESDRFLPRSARLESTTLVRRHRRRWPWPATQAIHSRVQHAT